MKKILIGILVATFAFSCTTHQKVMRVEPQIQQEVKKEEPVLKRKVAIARFTNETQYAKGLFYKKENNPIENQAMDILSTKLAASNKFILLERQQMDKISDEMKAAGTEDYTKVAADYVIIGSITEFGRKNVGDQNAFSRSVKQTVQAGVSLRLIDVSTGQVIYSEEGKGEAEVVAKTVMGLGESADYDATLSDKAISAAISKLVENIINNCMEKPWRTFFIAYDENGILVSGGKSQGLKVGNTFETFEKGKRLKNPQTGMMMELPGKSVGKIKIIALGGENPQSEFSIVQFTEGGIDKQNLSNYYIKEIK